MPPDGAAYPQILRGEGYLWWRSVLGVVLGLSLFLLMTTVVSQAVVAVAFAASATQLSYRDYVAAALAFRVPSGMLGANLGIAMLIPISYLLITLVHQVRPRWLNSVQPGIRWRYLLSCLGLGVVALGGVLLVTALVGPPMQLTVQRGFLGFLVVILLTSPIQAAAEEVFFRGYLMQALGSLFRQPWVGVVISSVVFAVFHGTQNAPLFVDRLAFGLLAALLVWRTGGIEAGIAAHVVNNVFAYVVAGLTTSIESVRAIRSITWLDAAVDVGGFALFAALAWWVAHRWQLRNRVDLQQGQ